MIYGNKFYNHGFNETTELTLMYDMINLDNLVESFNIDTETLNEKAESVFDKIFEKITDLIRKIVNFLKKAINGLKVKVVTMGNKIIKKLDDIIAGKEYYIDDFEDDFDDDFFDDEDIIEVIHTANESALLEANSDKEIKYCLIGTNLNADKMAGYVKNDYMKDLLGYAEKYVNVFDKFVNSNGKEGKDELAECEDDYKTWDKDELSKIMVSMKEAIDSFSKDFNELKGIDKSKSFKTENEYFRGVVCDANKESKGDLSTTREWVRNELDYIQEVLKFDQEVLSNTLDFQRGVKRLEDKITRINDGVITYGTAISALKEMIASMSTVASRQYQLVSLETKALLYTVKNNYKVAFKLMKIWGYKSSKAEKKESEEEIKVK